MVKPPYGKEITPFINKFIHHKEGAMLIFARMVSESVQELCKSGATFFMLRRRISFINKYGNTSTNSGADSCLVFYNSKYIPKCSNFLGCLMRGGFDMRYYDANLINTNFNNIKSSFTILKLIIGCSEVSYNISYNRREILVIPFYRERAFPVKIRFNPVTPEDDKYLAELADVYGHTKATGTYMRNDTLNEISENSRDNFSVYVLKEDEDSGWKKLYSALKPRVEETRTQLMSDFNNLNKSFKELEGRLESRII
jgi:hypothetical protein